MFQSKLAKKCIPSIQAKNLISVVGPWVGPVKRGQQHSSGPLTNYGSVAKVAEVTEEKDSRGENGAKNVVVVHKGEEAEEEERI